jgi:hypothetical protein
LQEEAIRELSAALQAKDEELSDARKQAAAEADAAVLQSMQVCQLHSRPLQAEQVLSVA